MRRQRALGTFYVLGFICLQSPACFAQLADVRLRGDISIGVVKSDGIQSASVTPLGRFSTLGLQAMLPVGVRINVIQRVSGFKNDVDDDGFDELSNGDSGFIFVGGDDGVIVVVVVRQHGAPFLGTRAQENLLSAHPAPENLQTRAVGHLLRRKSGFL